MSFRAFKLHFKGQNLFPETISLGELSEILIEIEKAISSLITLDPNESEVSMSLIEVEKGSAEFAFSSNSPDKVREAGKQLVTATRKQKLSELPKRSQETVKKLSEYARKRNATIGYQAYSPDDVKDVVVPWLGPNIKLGETEVLTVKGPTILYGEIMRVGGKEPRIRIESQGQIIYCDASRDLARKVATKLYTRVGLEGIATWNTNNWAVEEFKAMKLLDYQETPITAAMADLANVVGPEAWKDRDIVKSVELLRRG